MAAEFLNLPDELSDQNTIPKSAKDATKFGVQLF